MGGEHHHSERLAIPDYRIYHVGDHTPRLQKIEKLLAAKGLKDPWIRNEVWRYDERMHGTPRSKILQTFGLGGRGFAIGKVILFWLLFRVFARPPPLDAHVRIVHWGSE